MGTPSAGSVLADYASFFPFNSLHITELKEEIKSLLTLQENISYYQESFPKLLSVLGSKDMATSIQSGYIGFKFAKNYQVPLAHSELYKFEKYPYMYKIIDDFILNDLKNYSDNIPIKNDLYIRLPQLSDLKYYIRGTYRLYPLTQQELYDNGYKNVILKGKNKQNYRHKGYGYHERVLTFEDLGVDPKVATDNIQVGKVILAKKDSNEKFTTIMEKDIKTIQKEEKKYKYQHKNKIQRHPNKSLWCKSDHHRFSDKINYDFNILSEIDYMTLSEIQNEMIKTNFTCAIEEKKFIRNIKGSDKISKYVPWGRLLQKIFMHKKNIIIDNDKIYSWSVKSILPATQLQRQYEYVIIKDLPLNYKYDINLTKHLKNFLTQEKVDGFNFNFTKDRQINLKIHKGKNYKIVFVR